MNILVTGGGSGLGEAIVRRCSSNQNDKIYFTFNHSKENAQSMGNDLGVYPLHCDFSQQPDIDLITKKIVELDIDVLVNNAIAFHYKNHFHKIDTHIFLESFNQNILPVIQINQSMIRHSRKKKSGHIITVLTSALQEAPPVGSSEYLSHKAYLHSLSQSWYAENKKFNLKVDCLFPVFMDTAFHKDLDSRIIDQIMASQHITTPEQEANKVFNMIHV